LWHLGTTNPPSQILGCKLWASTTGVSICKREYWIASLNEEELATQGSKANKILQNMRINKQAD
jgi:hypothetical protein